MIIYKGVTAFTLQTEEPTSEHYGCPTITQTYKGAAPQFDAFWKSVETGIPLAGGYIVKRNGANRGMYPEISISIALPPDFLAYRLSKSRLQQTSSKGRTVVNSSILRGYLDVEAQRTISFIAPQAVYSYFSSTRPLGPRFTSPVETSAPILLKSVIYAKGGTIDENYTGSAKRSEATYYGNAPIALATALAMPAVGLITGHTSDPIPGTPWYECQDVISYVYRGDDA